MKRLILPLVAVLAAVSALGPYRSTPGVVHAQEPQFFTPKIAAGEPDGVAVTAISTDTALLVKYVGSGASGKVAVSAAGDLTFTEGTQGSEVANATFECPVSGALGGIIDVSDTACDTLGEVCDVINGNNASGGTATSATNWRCVILDGLRSDSSDDRLTTIAATAATAEDGLALKWDGAVAFKTTYALGAPRKIGAYFSTSTGGVNPGLVPNPFAGRQALLLLANETSTYGSGASAFEVVSVKVKNGTGGAGGTETVGFTYSRAGGATTVNASFNDDILGRKDEKLLVRINNTAAMSASTLYAYGLTFRY
jgi:hypothetical protein